MPIPQILVAGGVNMDTTYRVENIPSVGESVRALDRSYAIGGKGLNQAIAVRRAGLSVAIVGAVGADSAGDEIRAFLETEDISSRYLAVIPSSETGQAIILIDDNADNAIVVDLGANSVTDAGIVAGIGDDWTEITAVVANGEAPAAVVENLFRESRQRAKTTVWNPSPMPTEPDQILRLTDTLIVNENEAKDLAGPIAPTKRLAERLLMMGPSEVIITLGRAGSLVAHQGRFDDVSSPKVVAVDPTSAGDTFLGYYVVSRSNNLPPAQAANLASAAAALCVQVSGASNSIPHRNELLAAGQVVK